MNSRESLQYSSESFVKESGVPWIGMIPDDWDVQPLKRVISCIDGKRVPIDASARTSGPYPYWGAGNVVDHIDQYLFDEELVLLGEDGAPFFDKTRPVAFHINEKVWVNNHIHVLKAKGIDPSYLTFVLNSVDYHEYISGSILPKLTQSDMNSILIPVPPISDQKKIAGYVSSQCEKIDSIIDSQNEFISKLSCLKQSIISETVTKGLDPRVLMIDSNIPFIEKAPASWQCVKLKYVASERNDVLRDSTDPDFEFSYVEISDVSQSEGIHSFKKIKFKDAPSRARRLVKKNDIIISTVRTYLKAIASVDEEDMVVSTGFLVISSRTINYKFLKYVVLSDYFISTIIEKSYGVSYPAITSDGIMNLKVLIPPEEEQLRIVNYLDSVTLRIDALIHVIESVIHSLTSLKQSYIYEYVTGKRLVIEEAHR